MQPGTYLRLRRQAAGLTIEQAAARIALRPSNWQPAAAAIAACEAGGPPGQYLSLAMQLTQAFAFDFAIWETLAERAADPASELPAPRVCAGCGCSWADPCGPAACAWRDPSHHGGCDLCTACTFPDAEAAHPEFARAPGT